MKAMLALARVEIILFLSNRRALIMSLVAPILIAAFFGALFGGAGKPNKVPVAVVDQDNSAVSMKLTKSMMEDSSFTVMPLDETAAIEQVRKGKQQAAVVIPKGFGDEAAKALFRPDVPKPRIAIHYDPSQSATLAMVKGLLTQYAMQAVSAEAFSSNVDMITPNRHAVEADTTMDNGLKKSLLTIYDGMLGVQQVNRSHSGSGMQGGLSLPFETADQEVTSGRDKKYNNYSHSFGGMGVQFILMMGIELGMGVLLMRRQGIWQRLRAAPISRAQLLGSRVLSGTVVASMMMSGIFAAGIVFFGVRVEGSWLGFAGIIVSFAVMAATFGLLIAALGRTPEATRPVALIATLLMVMIGGAWVPTFMFPQWIQNVALFIPTRWAVDGFDSMTWRGLGLNSALLPIAVMLGFSAVFTLIAVKSFRWQE